VGALAQEIDAFAHAQAFGEGDKAVHVGARLAADDRQAAAREQRQGLDHFVDVLPPQQLADVEDVDVLRDGRGRGFGVVEVGAVGNPRRGERATEAQQALADARRRADDAGEARESANLVVALGSREILELR